MNKEIEKVFTERGFTNIEQMATMFDYYKQEIERLREHTSNQDRIIAEANNRIYKAIEYIESCAWSNGIDNELQYSLHIPSLLKILKGVDKE